MVLAPEHKLVDLITTPQERPAVNAYREAVRAKSDLERTDLAKDKTGVFTGAWAVNPVNGEKIPVWIADYILVSYGTGAIMAVPSHDERDWDFAKKFGLKIIQVVSRDGSAYEMERAEIFDGYAVNSGPFNGLTPAECKKKMIAFLEEKGIGKKTVNYKLRDWVFSRQRYWGEPVPLVHCPRCGIVPLDFRELPLALPEVESYTPTGTGESPLAAITDWVRTSCPKCGGPAQRETNTMPQWAGSCWYYMRFTDPHNTGELAAREKLDYWLPVDLYVGGAEHAVLHLLYARFWHKVLHEAGVVGCKEPFARLVNQGMILGEDNQKMSKSLGNVINPDDIVREYGADSMRVYEMFMGPLQVSKPWSTNGLVGVHRFLDRVWRVSGRPLTDAPPPEALVRTLHKTLKKVGGDTQNLEFNTAIAQMMIFINDLYKEEKLYRKLWEPFVLILSPYAPHLAEELWERLGNSPSISGAPYPVWEEELTKDEECTVVFQVNGKVRARENFAAGVSDELIKKAARENERVKEYINGKTIVKTIVVSGRLVNIVVR
jgi:leucyl-tRNA synthetase